MYVNMGVNSGSEKLWRERNTATSGKLIKAVYAVVSYKQDVTMWTVCTQFAQQG
jgi:hypothetical protein